jgi:nitrate reductase (NAD(P)H)
MSSSISEQDFVYDPSKPHYSMEEIAKHSTAESPWIVVNNRVYDCTLFLKAHPGGADSILINAGTDCSEEFDAIHSKKAWKMLDEYHIGQLEPNTEILKNKDINAINTTENEELYKELNSIEFKAIRTSEFALDPKQRIAFTLSSHKVLSPDSILLRFDLKHPNQVCLFNF